MQLNDADLFLLTCKTCGHSFNLTNQQLYGLLTLSCPECGQKISNWTFYELKRAYFNTISMVGKVLSLGPFAPEEPNFTFRIAGNPSEPEDIRLLRFMQEVYDIPITNTQDNTKEGEDKKL